MILAFISLASALVAALTGLAMLQDAHRRPADTSAHGWLRHILRLGLLIFVTAAGALLVVMPEARTASAYEVALRCGLAGMLAMQSPCPWWRYVFKGPSHVERRRPI